MTNNTIEATIRSTGGNGKKWAVTLRKDNSGNVVVYYNEMRIASEWNAEAALSLAKTFLEKNSVE